SSTRSSSSRSRCPSSRGTSTSTWSRTRRSSCASSESPIASSCCPRETCRPRPQRRTTSRSGSRARTATARRRRFRTQPTSRLGGSPSANATAKGPSRCTVSTARRSSTEWPWRFSRTSRARCLTSCARTERPSGSLLRVPRQPLLREPLLSARQPRLLDEVAQLLTVEPVEIRDAHEHGRVAVPVRRREIDASRVGEKQLLHAEIGDAEGEHIVEPFARLRIDCVRAPAAMETEHLPVHLVDGTFVLDLLRRLRHGERELV